MSFFEKTIGEFFGSKSAAAPRQPGFDPEVNAMMSGDTAAMARIVRDQQHAFKR
jgi:hypothetical protein